MSYNRRFSKTITIRYSGTVSYPASERGGTISYSGTATEVVDVNVHVDTNPFDHSVSNCNGQVNLLTGAVVATEAAQVQSIKDNSRQVASTIVKGFFKTIGSEISQQINELKNNIEATTFHLVELTKRCLEKKDQMAVDYQRLCQRYMKIFENLNNELENRIYEVDKPIFGIKEKVSQYASIAEDTDMVSTVVVSGAEEAKLQAQMSSAFLKEKASKAINIAYEYLQRQKLMDLSIEENMHEENINSTLYVPVIVSSSCDSAGVFTEKLYSPDKFNKTLTSNSILQHLMRSEWKTMSQEEKKRIEQHFNAEVNNHFADSSSHDTRVRSVVLKLFSDNAMQRL